MSVLRGKVKRGLCRKWGVLLLSVGWLMVQFFDRFESCERGGKGREKGEKVGFG